MNQRCRSRMKVRKGKVAVSPITAYFKKLAPDAKPRKPQVKLTPITSYFSTSKQAVENQGEVASGGESNKSIARNLSVEFIAQLDRKPLAILNTSSNSSQKSPKFCLTPLLQASSPVVSQSPVSNTPQSLPPSELSAVEDSPDQDSFLFDVTTPQRPPVRTVPVPPSPEISTTLNSQTPTMPVNAKRCFDHDVILVGDSPLPADRSVVDLTNSILPSPKRMCLVDLTESPMLILDSPTFQEPPHEGSGNAGTDRVILDSPMFQEPPHAGSGNAGTDRVLPTMGNGGVWEGRDRQPPEINVIHTARKEEKTSSKVISESVCVIADRVESFHLTSPTSPRRGSDPDPPATLGSEHASSSQVQLHQVPPAPPLSSSAPPSSELSSVLDCPDLLAPPPVSVSVNDELELLLWQRGAPYCKRCSPTQKVRLFGPSQDNMVENLMEMTSTASSRKLLSVLEYLTLATSASFMPKASQLWMLWEMVADPHVAANYLSADSLRYCIIFFRRVLSLHPPGQHPLVDTQYGEFVRLLGREGSPFAIWDSISVMLSGPETCAHLLSFLVDILLLDFRACLSSAKEPLFVKVFWQGANHGHITLPIRQLVDNTVRLAEKPSSSESEFSKLGSCTSLLFMATTRCQDLSTELTIACRRLPTDSLLLLLSLIQPTSLQADLVQQTAPSFQCTLSSVTDQLHPPVDSAPGPVCACMQQQYQPEEVKGHLVTGYHPPSSQSDEVSVVTGGSRDPEIHSVPTKAELVPSAVVRAQPVPSAVVRAQPLPSAVVRAQPVPSAVVRAQPLPSAVVRAQPLPSAVVRAQPVPCAVVRAQPVPSAVVRAQPLPSAVVRAQPVPSAVVRAQNVPSATMGAQPIPITVVRAQPVPRAVVNIQPIRSATMRAQPKKATSVQLPSTIPSNLKATTTKPAAYTSALPRQRLCVSKAPISSCAERGPPVSTHQLKPLSMKKSATQISSAVKGFSHRNKDLSTLSLSSVHRVPLHAKPFCL